MKGKEGVMWAVAVVVVAFIAFKIYPNYPTGKLGVLFYICTSSHQERQEFQATHEGMKALPIDASTHLNIIIHGYTESSIRSWVVNLTDALLSHDPGSVVILVDYYDLTTISRPYMMENARRVANVTAQLIDMLVEKQDVRLSNIHMMGFSLGGRISGLVGSRIKSGKIGRITGIDASYPWQPPTTKDEYLDAGDAEFVVNLRTSKIGALSPPGHVDFYFNGGMSQPGCEKYLLNVLHHICSHYRAVWLMLEAVTSVDKAIFPACKCPDWESYINYTCPCDTINHFALDTDPGVQGSFYLTTNSEAPYSRPLR